MSTKSLSTIANENYLKKQLDVAVKDAEKKDVIIKQLEASISKLNGELSATKSSLDVQATESSKHFSDVEALTREQARLQSQISQLRTRVLDQTVEYDLSSKQLQYQLDTQRRQHDREVVELRAEHSSERKKRDADWNAKQESELSAQKSTLTHQNHELTVQVASLKTKIEALERSEADLRGNLSDADRDIRALRVDLRRAQAGVPIIADTILPDPIEKTIHGLERKVDRLKSNVISQIEDTSRATADKDDFKTKCRTLQADLDEANRSKTRAEVDKTDAERRLGRKIEDLEAKLSIKAQEAKERDSALNQAARLKARLDDKDIEVSSLQDQLQHFKEELSIAKSKYEGVTTKLRTELIEERNKISQLENKIHTLESQIDNERKKSAQEASSRRTAEEQVKKQEDIQVQTEKEADKLASRVAKLEKNLRDLERATVKI